MVTPQLIERKDSRFIEDRRQKENEVFVEAIKSCDDATLAKITSILIEAGLLRE